MAVLRYFHQEGLFFFYFKIRVQAPKLFFFQNTVRSEILPMTTARHCVVFLCLTDSSRVKHFNREPGNFRIFSNLCCVSKSFN